MKIYYLLPLLFMVFISCVGDVSKKMDILQIDKDFRNGKLDESKEAIDKLLMEEQKNEYVWTMAGHIYSNLDKDSLAGVYYNKAISINANTEEAMTGLGILARKEENYPKAVDYYQKAIKINPQYAQAYSSLVSIHLLQREFKDAVDVGEKAFHLDKADPVIMANLSVAYHYYGDTIQRNKYYKLAKNNGYRNLESLQGIFEDELSLFD